MITEIYVMKWQGRAGYRRTNWHFSTRRKVFHDKQGRCFIRYRNQKLYGAFECGRFIAGLNYSPLFSSFKGFYSTQEG